MEKIFKRGDVVKLKSGGPEMTIKEYVITHDLASVFLGGEPQAPKESETANCTWFDGKKVANGKFHQDLLELVKK